MINLFNQSTIMYAEDVYQIGAGIRCIKSKFSKIVFSRLIFTLKKNHHQ